jgi:hypothetical protein
MSKEGENAKTKKIAEDRQSDAMLWDQCKGAKIQSALSVKRDERQRTLSGFAAGPPLTHTRTELFGELDNAHVMTRTVDPVEGSTDRTPDTATRVSVTTRRHGWVANAAKRVHCTCPCDQGCFHAEDRRSHQPAEQEM